MQSLYEPYAMIEYELRTVSPLQTMIFPLLFLCAVYMVFSVCVCVWLRQNPFYRVCRRIQELFVNLKLYLMWVLSKPPMPQLILSQNT